MKGHFSLVDPTLSDANHRAVLERILNTFPQVSHEITPKTFESYVQELWFRTALKVGPCPCGCQEDFVSACPSMLTKVKRQFVKDAFDWVIVNHSFHLLSRTKFHVDLLGKFVNTFCTENVEIIGSYFDAQMFDEDPPRDVAIQTLGGGVSSDGVPYRTVYVADGRLFRDPIVDHCMVIERLHEAGLDVEICPSRYFTKYVSVNVLNRKLQSYAKMRAASFMKVVYITTKRTRPPCVPLTAVPTSEIECDRRHVPLWESLPEPERKEAQKDWFRIGLVNVVNLLVEGDGGNHVANINALTRAQYNKGKPLGTEHLALHVVERNVWGPKYDGVRCKIGLFPEGIYIQFDPNNENQKPQTYFTEWLNESWSTPIIMQAEFFNRATDMDLLRGAPRAGIFVINDALVVGRYSSAYTSFWNRWTLAQRLWRSAQHQVLRSICWTPWQKPSADLAEIFLGRVPAAKVAGLLPCDGIVVQPVDAPGLLTEAGGSALYVKWIYTLDVMEGGVIVEKGPAGSGFTDRIRNDKITANTPAEARYIETALSPAEYYEVVMLRLGADSEARTVPREKLISIYQRIMATVPEGSGIIDFDLAKRIIQSETDEMFKKDPLLLGNLRCLGSHSWPWLIALVKENPQHLLARRVRVDINSTRTPIPDSIDHYRVIRGFQLRKEPPTTMMAGFLVTAGIYNRVLDYIDTVELATVARNALNRTWLEFGRVLLDANGEAALRRLNCAIRTEARNETGLDPYSDEMFWEIINTGLPSE
jgi:hypothetical protein